MKIRTLLFGAGQGARQYIENNSSSREFVGFLDNDESKHETSFEGLPIYAPFMLGELIYDQIVITTQWALDVQKQLINDFGVDVNKVVLPEKKQLKKPTPFLNPVSLDLARHIVKAINTLAIERELPLATDFGTLLGIVRDDDIIPWDDDIDFSVPVECAEAAEAVCQRFVEEQPRTLFWRLEKLKNNAGKSAGLLIKFTDPNGEVSEFTTSVCFRENVDGNALHMPSLGMWYAPVEYFDQTEVFLWKGVQIQVPKNYLSYLSFVYGDWKVPKKDIQLSDYAHTREVSFEDVKGAAMSCELLEQSNTR